MNPVVDELTEAAAATCRRRYRELVDECRETGLDTAALVASHRLSNEQHGTRFLQPIAYRPTGIALGAPLEDARLAVKLWEMAERVARQIDPLATAPPFVFVPPEAYHITIANRSHFEAEGEPVSMSPEVFADVVSELRGIHWSPIVLELDGLLVTRQGRLLVAGVPLSTGLARIRALLAARFPELRPIPETAHIKLGHFLAAPGDLVTLLRAVAVEGDTLAGHRIHFRDLYTPVKRITS